MRGPARRGSDGRLLREEASLIANIMIGAHDLVESKGFYDAALGCLGVPPGVLDHKGRPVYRPQSGTSMVITIPINGQPATGANGSTIAFWASSPEQADAWHAAGLAHGGITCENPPGWRELNGVKVYLAYLRDPAGNKICAMYRTD